ncbi:MAG: NAD(P)-binding domain-containing protein, partial [Gammaproteobacteria bacterium]|nr:NAD(P)-binding domain-containing protein [Gammaproteobacteria bacterium]
LSNIKSNIKTSKNPSLLDVFIVGAGPAGFSATLAAQENKLKYKTIEQESFGGTVFKFPRGKIVMTSPVNLPIVGKQKLRETTKEALLEFWDKVLKKTGIEISCNELLVEVAKTADGFKVKTSKNEYQTQNVLLCIGRRGTPRKLGVPGEELPKVIYQLIDPEQYKGKKVLIVGGGDSALEAALSISEQPKTTVTLSYRSDAFSRAKPKNRDKIDKASGDGKIKVIYSSNVKEITQSSVSIGVDSDTVTLDNDAVIISAGGILPTGFLKSLGVEIETKHGEA